MRLALLLLAALSAPALATVDDAIATANGPACAAKAPFYWEVGGPSGILASGSVKSGRRVIDRETTLSIASASKWPYGAFVNETRGGNLTAPDLKFLTFQSGFTSFSQCQAGQTVAQCAAGATYVRRTEGKFYYSGGHMQKHAATLMLGVGPMNAAALATALNDKLGTRFAYGQAQPAGGLVTTAGAYADFLQRVMSDKLIDGKFLQADAVPTQGLGTKSPVPEPWKYGRGHWIELDGATSSPGAFGFYPWISADKRLYGVLARSSAGDAWGSVLCGREIRKALQK